MEQITFGQLMVLGISCHKNIAAVLMFDLIAVQLVCASHWPAPGFCHLLKVTTCLLKVKHWLLLGDWNKLDTSHRDAITLLLQLTTNPLLKCLEINPWLTSPTPGYSD